MHVLDEPGDQGLTKRERRSVDLQREAALTGARQQAATAAVGQAGQMLERRFRRWEAIRQTVRLVQGQTAGMAMLARVSAELGRRLDRIEQLRRSARLLEQRLAGGLGRGTARVRAPLQQLEQLHLDRLTDAVEQLLGSGLTANAPPEPQEIEADLARYLTGLDLRAGTPRQLAEAETINLLIEALEPSPSHAARIGLLQLLAGLIGIFTDRLMEAAVEAAAASGINLNRGADAVRLARQYASHDGGVGAPLARCRVVSRPDLPVRGSDTPQAPRLGTLGLGQLVRVLQKRKKWVQVAWRPAPGAREQEGWVRAKYLRRLDR